jgi:hypothetical protein
MWKFLIILKVYTKLELSLMLINLLQPTGYVTHQQV